MKKLALITGIAFMLGFPTDVGAHPFEDAIYDACARHGCDGAHLVNTMYCESGGDPHAIGPNGEIGVLQFHPDTFYRIFGGSDIWNPWEQIDIAAFAFANGYADHWVCSGLYDGSPS